MNNQTVSLEQYKTLAIQAYYWTSFNPERRGANTIEACEKMLNEDLKSVPDSYKEKYTAKFVEKMTAWLHSESKCASAAVTGPAKFPVARMRKRANWADNKYSDFMQFRKRVISKIQRSERKRNAPSELAQAIANLDEAKAIHAGIKEAAKIMRKGADLNSTIEALKAANIWNEKIVITSSNYIANYGLNTWGMTNALAKVKRLEDRVKMLQQKEAMKEQTAETGTPEKEINGAKIVQDHQDDRVKIFFDGKPQQNVINALKSHGFRWSPFLKAWCRKLTRAAQCDAENILQKELKQAA